MQRTLTVLTIAALLTMTAATANAAPKPRDSQQSRNSSTMNVIAADFGDETTQGHVEAYETSDGAYIGYLELNGGEVCDPGEDPENPDDDLYIQYNIQTNQDGEGGEGNEPIPADTFEIGKRNATGVAEGVVAVQFGYEDQCAEEGGGGEALVYVTIDLTSDGTRIRDLSSSTVRGPDGSSSSTNKFSGTGAFGSVSIESLSGEFPYGPFASDDAGGAIGSMSARSSSRS